jgi:hypothetical protein
VHVQLWTGHLNKVDNWPVARPGVTGCQRMAPAWCGTAERPPLEGRAGDERVEEDDVCCAGVTEVG